MDGAELELGLFVHGDDIEPHSRQAHAWELRESHFTFLLRPGLSVTEAQIVAC